MKIELQKLTFAEVEKNFATDLARNYMEACGGNDGSCEHAGGNCEVAGTGPSK